MKIQFSKTDFYDGSNYFYQDNRGIFMCAFLPIFYNDIELVKFYLDSIKRFPLAIYSSILEQYEEY